MMSEKSNGIVQMSRLKCVESYWSWEPRKKTGKISSILSDIGSYSRYNQGVLQNRQRIDGM